MFAVQVQQQHCQNVAQQRTGVSEFFMSPTSFTNVVPHFSFSTIPQQLQTLSLQQQKYIHQDNCAVASDGMVMTKDDNTRYGGSNGVPVQTTLSDMSHLIWTTPKPNVAVMPTISCVDTPDKMNFLQQSVNCVFPSGDGHVGNQKETNNQTYLSSVSVSQEESKPPIMFIPSHGGDGSVCVNPSYFFVTNAPKDTGNIYLQHGPLAQGNSLHNTFVPSTSAATNPANQLYCFFPPSTNAEPQLQCNQKDVNFSQHSQLNTGATLANQYHEPSEDIKPTSAKNIYFPLQTPQQVHVNMSMPPMFFPPSYSCQYISNAETKTTGNLPQNNKSSGGVCLNGEKGYERRCGLPYSEDPVPIDTTKTQLLVNFIPYYLTDDEFRGLFTPFGEIHKKPTKIIYDREARRGKGYGFVYYKDGRSTEAAIKTLNGLVLGGRALKVRYANQQRSSVDCDSCVGDEEFGLTITNDEDIRKNNDGFSNTNQESVLNAFCTVLV